jgi:thioredoxin 1
MAIVNLTAKNFDSSVAEGAWVIDFWATWCGPCRMQGKLLENGAAMLEERGIKIGKVNVDEEQELAMRFGILSIPTLLVYKDGQKINSFVGVQQLSTLAEAIK